VCGRVEEANKERGGRRGFRPTNMGRKKTKEQGQTNGKEETNKATKFPNDGN
jgi:hypothetical protein